MPLRFRSGLVLACMLIALYVLFWKEDTTLEPVLHPVDAFKDDFGEAQAPLDAIKPFDRPTSISSPPDPPIHSGTGDPIHKLPPDGEARTSSAKPVTATKAPVKEPVAEEGTLLQEQYTEEYEALGQKENAREIYGQTLRRLVDTGAHEGFASAQLTSLESGSWSEFSTAPPMKYNPYPDYNGKAWKTNNQGEYQECKGANGPIEDLIVWSGHPAPFSKPGLGSWITLDLDSNLCFERENRLGPYGFVEQSADSRYAAESTRNASRIKRTVYENVNWGALQDDCVKANANRFAKHQVLAKAPTIEGFTNSSTETSNTSDNGNLRRMAKVDSTDFATKSESESEEKADTQEVMETIAQAKAASTIETEPTGIDPATGKKLHGLPEIKVMPQKRTAIVLRTHSDYNYTENDKQNIRSLISELSLRSGGEYQVFLLVQLRNSTADFTKDIMAYQTATRNSVPDEFHRLAVVWNDVQMKALYPTIPEEINNVHQSQWLSVQKFAVDHPEFDFFWNWELDVRYTGHHYNLLEKLHTWTKMQPRKNIWERNERYYIPSSSEHYTYMKFREYVKQLVGENTVWYPPSIPNLKPVGPTPPSDEPSSDDWKWGVREDADYISLAPMFNPVNTTWPGRNDVWGYDGVDTPRRASIGTHSRCSRKLLETMHQENLNGNHVSSEMTPQTVALLHGLKAVFAPIPVFFDRAWSGESLQKYFNPGPKGVSGSTAESPFSWGQESRFQGATWYYRATPPMRLINNWLGWEDTEIGGPEWEKTHGRTCLPPMLLHPIKDVQEPSPGHASTSDLPY